LELPKKVFGHPWLLTSSDKMSKSKGNVIYADDLVEKFGVDAVRFYLLHEIPFANDGNITYDLLIEKINSELANVLGNLVQRTISMGNKYFEGKVTNKNVSTDVDIQFIELINSLNTKVETKMDNYLVSDALTEIFNVLRASNKYIDDTTPWVLAKDEASKDRLETVIYNLLESIRVCAVLLKPFINKTSIEILRQLNNSLESFNYTSDNVYELGQPVVLFQRLDKEKVLEEFNIM
jgi:methionyl-tRNA synthetase